METNFELKNVTKTISQIEDKTIQDYILNFSDGDETKSISLTGFGKLKEAVKI